MLDLFITERCLLSPTGRVHSTELWHAYLNWCREQGTRPLGRIVFGNELEKRGYYRYRTGKARYIRGLELVGTYDG